MRKTESDHSSLLAKTNWILNLILLGLIIIGLRVWYLAFIQYEEKFEESKKPQRRTVLEPAIRGTIRDRFNRPLAINKIAYRVSLTYSPIRQIPHSEWVTTDGIKKKIFKRKAYIRSLAELLGNELHQDPDRIEDLIHAKVALYQNVPYMIKDELTEQEYYRLKMLQKDFPGLEVERYSKREYPKGKCACDLIGYLGAISKEQYETIIREKRHLASYLDDWENGEEPYLPEGFSSPLEVMNRNKNLQELAYSPNDFVGKAGVEAILEQSLRGLQGHKSYYADSKGNFLKALPGSETSQPGKRVLLSISDELQEYAEILLSQNEDIRFARSVGHDKKTSNKKQPWIRGGGIVVVDPKTGEILTLATYPRFDPNDFVSSGQTDKIKEKRSKIHRWFEDEAHIAELWHLKKPLERERYNLVANQFYDEKKFLTWNHYLQMILPENHPILNWFKNEGNLKRVIEVQKEIEELEKSGIKIQEWVKLAHNEGALNRILAPFSTVYTKLLFIDLCQLAAPRMLLSDALLKKVGSQSIDLYHESAASYEQVQEGMKEIVKELFRTIVFKRWRELNEKDFLKEKRKYETTHKIYPKPYLDYLDEKENELFDRFWHSVKIDLALTLIQGTNSSNKRITPFTNYFKILHKELLEGAHPALSWRQALFSLKSSLERLSESEAREYLSSLRNYYDLNRPLKGAYKRLRNRGGPLLERHLASAFYPTFGFGYSRSQAYRQAATLGSIFKLITSYEALRQVNEESIAKTGKMHNFNPLNITDTIFKIGSQTYLGYNASGKPIPQLYKGGRIPRSRMVNMGKMDLMNAIATSSNLYFSLLASDVLRSPLDLSLAASQFGFGEKTGLELNGEISGNVPQDLEHNRNGLYAMAIGQHTLIVTPIQTAMMLSAFANGGELLKPQIIKVLAGATVKKEHIAQRDEAKIFNFLGLAFPLVTSALDLKQQIETRTKEVRRNILMPKTLRKFMLESMNQVALRTQQESLLKLSALYADYPEAISDYVDLKHQLIWKTSTAESMERIDLDEEEGTNMYTHVWLGGIAFEENLNENFSNPELVIVVYLKYGSFGKEAVPIFAQMVQKWREIKSRHL